MKYVTNRGYYAKDFQVRVFIIFACFSLLFLILLVRLFLLQIGQREFFKVLSKQQYQVSLTTNLPRAPIYDRSGKRMLAFNKEEISAFILPHEFEDSQVIKKFLKKYYSPVFSRLTLHPEKHFLWLERKLPADKLAWLQRQKIADIHFVNEFGRCCPDASYASLIGLTDVDNHGIAGVELLLTNTLAGSPWTFNLEKEARSGAFYFEKTMSKKGVTPNPINLTIDADIQRLAHTELTKAVDHFSAKAGAVVVLNPDDGHIVAMANYLSPHAVTTGTAAALVLGNGAEKNIAVTECYEFGSVFKTFVALAALEEGVVTKDTLVDCEGKVTWIDGVRVENWKSVNVLTVSDVMKHSSNVGIAKVAKMLGPQLYKHLVNLGFGKKMDIQFPGERSGFLNHPSKWSKPSIIVLSFGYEVMASVLQLACAFGAIANGGYPVKPTLLCSQLGGRKTKKPLYKPSTIADMREILAGVGQRYPVPGFSVMGKTGTARCVKNGVYSDKDHRYVFAGIVERGAYRRVVVTFIDQPLKTSLWAAETTAPLFQAIAEKMVLYEATQGRISL